MQNCRFRHLNQHEYENEIFHALCDEFEHVYGPPDHRASSPPLANPFPASLGNIHNLHRKYGPSSGGFDDGLMPTPDDLRPLIPRSEYESEAKRPRYYSGDSLYRMDELRDREACRKWEQEYAAKELPEGASRDTYFLMQEVISLRNENVDLRTKAEREIAELKEEVRRAVEENTGLRHEVGQARGQAALDNLSLANSALMEDLGKAQETARNIEMDSQEKLNAMDANHKATVHELEMKIDALQKDALQRHDVYTNTAAALKKAEDEKAKLLAELHDLRAKMRSVGGGSGYGAKSAYSRDMEGSGSYSDLYGDRRGMDSRDQDRRGTAVRGSSVYTSDAWGSADKNDQAQYGAGDIYGMRRDTGATDSEWSRGWHTGAVQGSWSKAADSWSKAPRGGGLLMGEYRGDDRMNASSMRGSSYGNQGGSTGDSLLELPRNALPRNQQAGQMGTEGQNKWLYDHRDYGLTGYDRESRGGNYGSGGGAGNGWSQAESDGHAWRRSKY